MSKKPLDVKVTWQIGQDLFLPDLSIELIEPQDPSADNFTVNDIHYNAMAE